MKTAMQELIDDIKNDLAVSIKTTNPDLKAAAELAIKRTTEAILEQANSKIEMEKQQIKDANIYGWRQALDESVYSLDTEQYYNETYKNK